MPSLALVLHLVLFFTSVQLNPKAGPNPQLSLNPYFPGSDARFMFNRRMRRVNRGLPMMNQGLPKINRRFFIDESDSGIDV